MKVSKRGIIALVLAATLAMPGVALAKTDYSEMLDGLSSDELKELKAEIEERLKTEESSKADSNNNEFGVWTVKYFTDKFGRQKEELGNAYLGTTEAILGEFSNSATTNSDCLFYVFIFPGEEGEEPTVGIKMIEYGSSVVKAISEDDYFVSLLDKDENEHNAYAEMNGGGDTVRIDNDRMDAVKVLLKGGPITFAISSFEDSSSYRFTMEDTSGLEKALKFMGENTAISDDAAIEADDLLGRWDCSYIKDDKAEINSEQIDSTGLENSVTFNEDGTCVMVSADKPSELMTWTIENESKIVVDGLDCFRLVENELIYSYGGTTIKFVRK